MKSQIVCPNCKKVIANNSIIDDAEKRAGSDTQFIICDCGEKITYWQITTQLRNQKKLGRRIQNWFHGLSKG
jgi:transcription initiation factor TFIIIB Brf1 subunit/transcription initiation factor TFIIB